MNKSRVKTDGAVKARIKRTGFFVAGKMTGGWEFESVGGRNGKHMLSASEDDDAFIQLPPDGRVIVGGVEIVPWSEIRRKSMKKRQWYRV